MLELPIVRRPHGVEEEAFHFLDRPLVKLPSTAAYTQGVADGYRIEIKNTFIYVVPGGAEDDVGGIGRADRGARTCMARYASSTSMERSPSPSEHGGSFADDVNSEFSELMDSTPTASWWCSRLYPEKTTGTLTVECVSLSEARRSQASSAVAATAEPRQAAKEPSCNLRPVVLQFPMRLGAGLQAFANVEVVGVSVERRPGQTVLDVKLAADGLEKEVLPPPRAVAVDNHKGSDTCCHWRNKGWCRYQDKCKFRHPDGERGIGLPAPPAISGVGRRQFQPKRGCRLRANGHPAAPGGGWTASPTFWTPGCFIPVVMA
jgi:hypothetical protein